MNNLREQRKNGVQKFLYLIVRMVTCDNHMHAKP